MTNVDKKTLKQNNTPRDPRLDILASLPEAQSLIGKSLSVPNYEPDHAIREAVQTSSNQWLPDAQGETLAYKATNDLKVYLARQKKPFPADDAMEIVSQFSGSTALTARIAMGLWNVRRFTKDLAINGAAPMKIDEILAWRGIKKHTTAAHPGSSVRYTNGYDPKYKEAVLEDLRLLEMCHVKGICTIMVKGFYKTFSVHSPYLTFSPVYQNTLWGEILEGVFLSAGDWINVYDEEGIKFVAEAERRIFTFNPMSQQAEIRIALYLTERWRSKAKMQEYDTPIKMQDLLRHSAISIDKKRLTDRFIPRIEAALQRLHKEGILGESATPVIPRPQGFQPGRDWLASEWKLMPPAHIIEHYKEIASAVPSPAAITARKSKKKAKAKTTQENEN